MNNELKPCPFCDAKAGAFFQTEAAPAWNRRVADAEIARYREALESFLYEYGDKANSATVQKARAALKGPP